MREETLLEGEREDCRIGANPERQGQNSGQGERRMMPKIAQRNSHIRKGRKKRRSSSISCDACEQRRI
jgi:hypothetical protein